MIHRRDFLKKGAICTGAAALGSQAAAEARGENAVSYTHLTLPTSDLV